MGQNLTGQQIKDTYQYLVQISGSGRDILTDGTGSLITNLSITSSFAAQAGTSGYASTAGYAATAGTSGLAVTASYALQAGTAGFASQAGTAGFAVTASYAENAAGVPLALVTASINDATITFTKFNSSSFDITVNNVSASISASFADQAGTAGYAVSASQAQNAVSASYSLQSGTSGYSAFAANGFPYTGSARITGSLSVTGSIGVQSGSYNGTVIDNLTTPTASDAVYHVVALSADDYSAIPVPDPNTFYIINDATGSLILGNTTVSGSLTVTGTLNAPGLIVASASFAQTASYAFQAGTSGYAAQAGTSGFAVTASYAQNATPPFPYTGSAEISGSLAITGSGLGVRSAGASGGPGIVNINSYYSANSFNSAFDAVVMSVGANINNQSQAHGVAIGENHTIQSFGYNTFIGGGLGNTINSGANRSGMLGGSSNTLNGQLDSAIVGGTSNTVSHQNSVILGGSGLATTKNDEAVVEKFLISGSAADVFVIANYSALNYADDTAAAAGGVPLGGVYRNGNFLMIRIV